MLRFASAAILLKNLSARTYTTVTNLLLWVGMCVHAGTPSSSHQGWFWAGIPIISPGVNGSSSHAVKALAGALAEKEGYGRGEFSAWINNLRAIATACCTVLYSRWYSIATARGLWAGSVWWVAGLLGGLLPQLLVWAGPASDYEEVK